MGNSTNCLELCANTRGRHQDKEAVLEALGLGPIKQLKQQQLAEDILAGRLD